MNSTKYYESNILISQRKGLPSLVQQRIVISHEEIQLAELRALYKRRDSKIHDVVNDNYDYNTTIDQVWK